MGYLKECYRSYREILHSDRSECICTLLFSLASNRVACLLQVLLYSYQAIHGYVFLLFFNSLTPLETILHCIVYTGLHYVAYIYVFINKDILFL